MHLLVLVLNQEHLLDDILEEFINLDVRGATILDSVGMGRTIEQHIPIFAGLRTIFESGRSSNKTIFTVIENDAKLQRVVNMLRNKLEDFKTPGTGLLFVVPLSEIHGIARPIEEKLKEI